MGSKYIIPKITGKTQKIYKLSGWFQKFNPTFADVKRIFDGDGRIESRDDRLYWVHCTVIIVDVKNKKLIIYSIGRRLTYDPNVGGTVR